MKEVLSILLLFVFATLGLWLLVKGIDKNTPKPKEYGVGITPVGQSFYLLHLANHDYIAAHGGGITHLESCVCKNK